MSTRHRAWSIWLIDAAGVLRCAGAWAWSWNITTTPTVNPSAIGFTSLPGASYSTNGYTSASTSSYLNASSFGVRNLPGPGVLQFGLVFATPLTDAGGTVALKVSGGGFESTANGFASRPVVAGVVSVVAAPGPEPASAALLLAGGAALLWRRRTLDATRRGPHPQPRTER